LGACLKWAYPHCSNSINPLDVLMMKRSFYSFLAAVSLMWAVTSCSQEEMIGNEASENEVEVSFNVDMEGQTTSRTIGDGLTVDKVHMAVYDVNKAADGTLIVSEELLLLRKVEDVTNKGAVVKVRLVKGQTYAFVFWAQNEAAGHYDLTNMTKIKVKNYATDANDESRDAFYKYVEPIQVTGSFSQNVTLKRPFAQLNLGTTAQDIAWAKTAGIEIAKSKVKVEGAVYTTLNTITGEAEDLATVDFSLAAIPDAEKEELEIKDSENQFAIKNYEYLATDYLLANTEAELSTNVTFTLVGSNDEVVNHLTVSNAPLQRNWRTNIVGEILTGEGTFNIVIDPIFEADRNYPMDGSDLDIWDNTYVAPTQNAAGEYEIDAASKLAYIWQQDASTWNNATFVLTKDLSFKNVEFDSRAGDTTPATIEPLFGEGTGASNVIFKGNDHVIRDFVIDGDNNLNSLFGGMVGGSIQNLTVINAEVKGQKTDSGRAAIVVAQTFGNVKLDNVTVKDSYLEGVQKIGGLIGFVHENQVEVSNCTVDGLVLTSLDLGEETGATGGLIGYINTGDNKITNSYVKNSTLNLIQGKNDASRANGEFIGVIAGSSKTTITNCGVSDNTFPQTDWVPFHELVGGHRDGNATLIVNGVNLTADEEDNYPDYVDKGTYYEVYKAAGLLKWGYQVNAGDNDLGLKLMRDIVMPAFTIEADAANGTYKFTSTPITVDEEGKPSGSNWVPVGSSEPYYQGKIDGQGHVIKKLRVSGEGNYQGFVALLKTEQASIQNLDIEEAFVYTQSGVAVGAFVGNANVGALIENCNLKSSKVTGRDLVGGIVGYNQNTSVNNELTRIFNCSVDGISSITGLGYFKLELHGVGGIAGMNYGSIIRGCTNAGSVSGSQSVGGIAGLTRSYNKNISCYIIDSHNSGSISGTKNLGGVAGYNLHDKSNHGTNSESVIVGCSSTASSISGNSKYKGLIVGYLNAAKIYSSWASSIGNVVLQYNEGDAYVIDGIYSIENNTAVSSEIIAGLNNAMDTYNSNKQQSDVNYCSSQWSWTSGSWPVLAPQE